MRLAVLGTVLALATGCGRLEFEDLSRADAAADAAPSAAFDPEGGGCTAAEAGPLVEAAAFATAGGGYGVWSAPPYVLMADTSAGLHALRFDGTTFTETGSLPALGWVEAVYRVGAHYFVGAPGTGLYVVDIAADGSLSQLASNTTTLAQARRGWPSSGDLAFVPSGGDGLFAVHFDGTALTTVGTGLPSESWAQGAWAADSRVLFADADALRMLDFDGSAFAEITTPNTAHTASSRIWSDGTTAFVANSSGVTAFSLGSTAIQETTTFATSGAARDVWSDGQHVFAVDESGQLTALTYAGGAFTLVDQLAVGTSTLGVFGDGTYIYANDLTTGLHAYRGFGCQRW